MDHGREGDRVDKRVKVRECKRKREREGGGGGKVEEFSKGRDS